jgi:hypothetical protein
VVMYVFLASCSCGGVVLIVSLVASVLMIWRFTVSTTTGDWSSRGASCYHLSAACCISGEI